MKNKNKQKQSYNQDMYYGDEGLSQVAKTTLKVTFKVLIIGALVVALYIGAGKAYDYGYDLFNGSTMQKAPGTDIMITVKDGMSHSELAELLEKKGLIEDATAAKILLSIFTASDYDILPGEYTLNTSMTLREMIDEMVGDVPTEAATDDHLGLYD